MQLNSALDPRVDPQGAYLAYKCPQAIQLDILSPVRPLPPSDFFAKLGEEGSTYQDEVFDLLRSQIPGGAEYIPPHLDADLREELTLECLNAGVPLILGGRLPTDTEAHRAGEPDLLVRASDHPQPSGQWEYRAVDVKGHLVYSSTDEPADDLTTLLLLDPRAGKEGSEESRPRCNPRDVLQLAHYQRMLEACGHAAAGDRWGGIIGKELRLAWYDLDAESGDPVVSEDGQVERLSAIEVYDSLFASKLEVIDRANRHKEDPSIALLAEPVLISDCATCCWQEFCMEKLEEAADLSLIRGVNREKRRQHHDLGTMDLHGLARLDYTTAKLMKENVDLVALRTLTQQQHPSTPIAEIIPRRRGQISKLKKDGFHTVSDLSRLHERTMRYADTGMNDLVEQIDLARARVAAGTVYRRRGVDSLNVPRGDVEIDVDMESTNDGAYLWGVLVSRHIDGQASFPEYKSFVSWDRPTETARVQALKEFWDWLCEQRDGCTKSNRTLRAYCFSKGAENHQMKRVAPALGIEDDVNEFLASEQWVDLHEVVRKQLVTGDSMGLKDIAPLAGFSWRDEDSGGTQAIVRYDEASATYESLVRDEARQWLLDYNEDDVRATAALREWLDGAARKLPSVEDISF